MEIGDKYNESCTIFWKGGAVCGGIHERDAEPICWISESNDWGDHGDLVYQEDLDWLTLC